MLPCAQHVAFGPHPRPEPPGIQVKPSSQQMVPLMPEQQFVWARVRAGTSDVRTAPTTPPPIRRSTVRRDWPLAIALATSSSHSPMASPLCCGAPAPRGAKLMGSPEISGALGSLSDACSSQATHGQAAHLSIPEPPQSRCLVTGRQDHHRRFGGVRHHFATRLLSAGASVADVQKLLGHSSVAITTKVSWHANTDALAEVYARFSGGRPQVRLVRPE